MPALEVKSNTLTGDCQVTKADISKHVQYVHCNPRPSTNVLQFQDCLQGQIQPKGSVAVRLGSHV